ncbi:ATP-binding cassette domain-containing protein [Roseomonas sp. OT10]|uniref:ABC transporter ATP-binding protein n=1 Tax=Roseomonas cutis TaxID=2897332 RepID=UPI001E2E6FEC|nr:ATP-binding cassette domain-containing protein [Roseomonas sp. OT10]UFN47321.1 ATP-binding cassette domain-containing protein [Roseomonas sp. OT10]
MSVVRLPTARLALTVRGLRKFFAGQPVYDGFDLQVRQGDILSIFGPNGCGKSTLINMLAGLLPTDGGEILFDGRLPAEVRIGYVFQNYREALFPWRRAADNIRYPLRLMGLPRAEIERRVEALSADFRVRFDLNRYPYELSGGQQQLVSIMRALAVEPEVLFLDEPFSALDYETTLSLRELLQDVLKRAGVTTLLVSHDLEESIVLGDRVLMLTRRPTRVADDVPVPLFWPRTAETLSDLDFVAIKRRCLDAFTRAVQAA